MDRRELPIASPCNVDWNAMTPADKGRFCGDCKKVVRDLSQMSEREARSLLGQPGRGELCVRYLYDKHGKVFFAGDRATPALVPAAFLHRAKRVALVAAAFALQACSQTENHEDELTPLMGGMPGELMPVDAGDGGDAGSDGASAADADGGAKGDAHADASTEETDASPDAGPSGI